MKRLLPLLLTGWFALGAAWPELVSDPDPRVRMRAYRSLEASASAAESLDTIAAALVEEDDPRVRAAARDAMARLPLTEAQLQAALADSPYPIARAWAAYALGFYHSAVALESLMEAADDRVA